MRGEILTKRTLRGEIRSSAVLALAACAFALSADAALAEGPANDAPAPAILREIRYAMAPGRGRAGVQGVVGQLTLRGDRAEALRVSTFGCRIPETGGLAVESAPLAADGGFRRLPFRSIVLLREWRPMPGPHTVTVEAEGAVSVEGERVVPGTPPHVPAWRLELTFVPDAPK